MANLQAREAADNLRLQGFASADATGDGVHLDSDDAIALTSLIDKLEASGVIPAKPPQQDSGISADSRIFRVG